MQAVNHVHIPFAKPTMWKKAIVKGTMDSCREVHEDMVNRSLSLVAEKLASSLRLTYLFCALRTYSSVPAHQHKLVIGIPGSDAAYNVLLTRVCLVLRPSAMACEA